MRDLQPRSWLFVPGDSERKLAKIADSGADAVIIDLEDAVAPSRKTAALELTKAYLYGRRQVGPAIWVRLNADEAAANGVDNEELRAVAAARPDGIMVPKAAGAHTMRALATSLDALGHERIMTIPVATETPAAALRLSSYADGPVSRMAALTWGAEDLGAALGMAGNRDATGAFRAPFTSVRTMALLAAKAAEVQAVETLHADFRDADGLEAMARNAAADGFTGQLAIHPAQVPIINTAFVPDERSVVRAEAIVAAFKAAGDEAGTASLDGRMLDRPHLREAQTLLARARAFRST